MATVEQETASVFGKSVKRREDPRFLTGRGRYTDDLALPGTVHAAFVRSPHAHARIRGVDSSQARQSPGVVAVYTGKDLADAGVNALPPGWLLSDLKIGHRRVLATGTVRYAGEAV